MPVGSLQKNLTMVRKVKSGDMIPTNYIRDNPVTRTTDLLQKVFGALKK
jgi:hypothetical protein